MIIVDENFDRAHRDQLRRWHIRTRQVGDEFGRKSLLDWEIVGLLQRGRRATFISLDRDFYRRDWRHPRYCLVFLDVPKELEPLYARRFLQHPLFDAEVKRLGHVIRVAPGGLTFWRPREEREEQVRWP